MAWRRRDDKPLSEPMMVSLLMHICVTRPQWVIGHYSNNCLVNMIVAWGPVSTLSPIQSLHTQQPHPQDSSSLQELSITWKLLLQAWISTMTSPPVTSGYRHRGPEIQSFDDVFVVTLIKLLNKHFSGSLLSISIVKLFTIIQVVSIKACPFSKSSLARLPRILKFFDLLIWNKEEKSVQIHLPD